MNDEDKRAAFLPFYLRQYAAAAIPSRHGPQWPPNVTLEVGWLTAAADTIERLTAEVERLRRAESA